MAHRKTEKEIVVIREPTKETEDILAESLARIEEIMRRRDGCMFKDGDCELKVYTNRRSFLVVGHSKGLTFYWSRVRVYKDKITLEHRDGTRIEIRRDKDTAKLGRRIAELIVGHETTSYWEEYSDLMGGTTD